MSVTKKTRPPLFKDFNLLLNFSMAPTVIAFTELYQFLKFHSLLHPLTTKIRS